MISTLLRRISPGEIRQLEQQGCRCDNWSDVSVADDFDPARIRNVRFSGTVSLGVFRERASLPGGRHVRTGIYDAAIHNCQIRDNVYISTIHTAISNYVIEEKVVIENVDSLFVEGESSFGTGVRVLALNEAGGRAVPIYDALSPQLAYIFAIEQHRPKLIAALEAMVQKQTAALKSNEGRIARGARIFNCGLVRNVRIDEAAELDGVQKLDNGSIVSSKHDPVLVGSGVTASDFIFAPGARVDSGAIIDKCYIGAGCTISKQFSAHNCLFFNASEAKHGEAISVFAGPLSVTEHKSTLLIAGMFSFFNAGSGTNQSNHMYKLGPVHQGVLERGCKTASDAYLLWPSRLGPFTTIIGRHYRHVDTSDFPFSLLIAEGKTTTLIPAIILHNIGAWRDEIKWRERINECSAGVGRRALLKLLSPLVIQRMLNGMKKLYDLRKTAGDEHVQAGQFFLKGYAIQRALEIYDTAIILFLQQVIVNHFADAAPASLDEFHSRLAADKQHNCDAWIDAAGMLAPSRVFNEMLDNIENGSLASFQEIENEFDAIYLNYDEYEWIFATGLLQKRLGKSSTMLQPSDLIALLEESLIKAAHLQNQVFADSAKEFNDDSMMSFGLNGGIRERRQDFKNVRGAHESNYYVRKIKANFASRVQQTKHLIAELKRIQD